MTDGELIQSQKRVIDYLVKDARYWAGRHDDCVQRSTREVPRDADVASTGFDLAGTSVGKSGTRGGVRYMAGPIPWGIQVTEGTSGGVTTTGHGYFWYDGTRVGGKEESCPQAASYRPSEVIRKETHWPDGRKRHSPLTRVKYDGSLGEVQWTDAGVG